MKNLWNNSEAEKRGNDPLKLRVYSSRLLGQEADLVLHGGGNTSVKTREQNLFGEEEDIILVKGSGWDLATIEEAGFAPVKLNTLLQLAELNELRDPEMVKQQRMAMTDPAAPNPSVEAILHAIIPFKFVDHTHADAVVTITNTSNGRERIEEIYGEHMLIVPYVMPGFILAKQIYELTKDVDWSTLEGMILLNHGVFTFHDDAKVSYEKMIEIVSKAEDYLANQGAAPLTPSEPDEIDTLELSGIRRNVSNIWGNPVLVQLDTSAESITFSKLPNLNDIATRGPLTPDHIIRTKRTPLILSNNHVKDLENYSDQYQKYFAANDSGGLICLDTAPRWAIKPGQGILSFGTSVKNANIIKDISRHTMKAIYQAEHLGGWQALPESDLFEMEYWVLEQEKLKKDSTSKPMQGQIALVTGAASGIGKACVERLLKEGAVVAALDINPSITTQFSEAEVLGIECDVRDSDQINAAIRATVLKFGGLDMLVSNAGIFPKSVTVEEMDPEVWDASMNINLTSQQQLMKACLPYLSLGIEPAIVIVGSKNVAAPGPGAGAYSVAKAGLTQLGRVAALELGDKGIRVNMLHPNAVFDTGVWSDEVLKVRAEHYNLSVEEYKTNNILKVEITSLDVAEMIVSLLGPTFSKVTGAQIPIDGGNERTI